MKKTIVMASFEDLRDAAGAHIAGGTHKNQVFCVWADQEGGREMRRQRHGNGQFKRLTPEERQAQIIKTRARARVAAQLQGEINMLKMVLSDFFTRSLWGRIVWIVTGR